MEVIDHKHVKISHLYRYSQECQDSQVGGSPSLSIPNHRYRAGQRGSNSHAPCNSRPLLGNPSLYICSLQSLHFKVNLKYFILRKMQLILHIVNASLDSHSTCVVCVNLLLPIWLCTRNKGLIRKLCD